MLTGINYVPLLRSKVAEVSAFRNLSTEVKAAVLPVFLTRPWQNAKHFDLTIERVREATAGRTFALGLDRARYNHGSSKPAQAEFDALFLPTAGFRGYYELVEEIGEAVPVLLPPTSPDNLLLQLGNADALHRGLFIHYSRESTVPVLNIAGSVPPLPQDTVFVVDSGWSRDYLGLEAWTTSTVQRILSAVPEAEIVVMCSSFPDSFGAIVGHGAVPLHERRLFSASRQRFQEASLTYGDWATTRPPQSGGGGRIPSRIDVPNWTACDIFRADPDVAESYQSMAAAACSHPCFSAAPACFGKQSISDTANGTPLIKGPQKATEARINIHMTIQSAVGDTMPHDEIEYVD
ncbi:MAG: beta family protein [Allosphingosinicella sp.]